MWLVGSGGSQFAARGAQPSLLTRADQGHRSPARLQRGSRRDRTAHQATLQGPAQPVLPIPSRVFHPLGSPLPAFSPEKEQEVPGKKRGARGQGICPSPFAHRGLHWGQPEQVPPTLFSDPKMPMVPKLSQSGRKYIETQAPLLLLILGAACLPCGRVTDCSPWIEKRSLSM